MYANRLTYLKPALDELDKKWPENRTVNIVCHGHSVPSGYFATPFVDTFRAYPHLLHRHIKERFPFAVVNVIVTAIGGENSERGAERFDSQVLNLRPDVLTIDYALNDRIIGLQAAETAWRRMIEKALENEIKVILLTPSWDKSCFLKDGDWNALEEHSEQIRNLASGYQIGLTDVFQRFADYVKEDDDLTDLLSHVNHPNYGGHVLIAREIAKYFGAV